MRFRSLKVGIAVALVAACTSKDDQGDPAATGGAATGGTSTRGGNPGTTGGTAPETTGGTNPGGTPAAPSGGKSASSGGVTSTTGGTAGGSGGASGSQSGGSPPAATGGVSSGGMASAGAGGTVPAGPPAVRFVGRMDTSDAAGPKFAWSGSGMIARFRGTQVGAKLVGGQEYTVVIDGEVKAKLVPTNGTSPLANGLPDTEHTVELYRRTEAGEGEAQFLGFDLGAGELLSPPAAPARKLELIGDSISCGYGNEGANMDCGFTPQTENHYLTYGALAARALGAELVTVAWSGKGVVCNYGDAADSCMNPLPTYYDRILPNRADSAWDHSRYQPDAVVINLGTNDFSTDSDPSQMDFEGAYRNFVSHLRSKYPNAQILLTNGSMLSGTDLSTVRGYIAGVVKAFNDQGDAKVKGFEIEPQSSADGYGCDWHPNLVTHQKMATALEAALKNALGW